mgnify:CR=1 FL=1
MLYIRNIKINLIVKIAVIGYKFHYSFYFYFSKNYLTVYNNTYKIIV